jgi:hypothetical protein
MTSSFSQALWRNARLVLPFALLQSASYWLLNHYPLWSPRRLPLTMIDEALPFWPWTVWPYLALLLLAPLLPLLIQSEHNFRRLLLAYFLAIPATFAVFLLFPTEYVRPPAPLDDSPTSVVYRWLIAVDTEGCCFPSGHIVVPFLFGWGLLRDGRRWGMWLFGLVALLAPTILTTKQHYLWDLLGALAVVTLSLVIANVLIYRFAQRSANR